MEYCKFTNTHAVVSDPLCPVSKLYSIFYLKLLNGGIKGRLLKEAKTEEECFIKSYTAILNARHSNFSAFHQQLENSKFLPQQSFGSINYINSGEQTRSLKAL